MPSEWAARADALQSTLVARFWDARRRLYRSRPGAPVRRYGRWDYWWQAHALDATVDWYERAPSAAVADRLRAHLAGILVRGGGSPVNDFYDDMGWLGLALEHLWRSCPGLVEVPPLVDRLLAEIRRGESAVCGGGVAWATHHRAFKNVPANGPAAMLAARWGAVTGDAALVDWAADLVAWLHRTLVTGGVVHDGAHGEPDGSWHVERAEYSYNYGVVVGADLALARATGDVGYLDRAGVIAASAVDRVTDPRTKLWRAEGGGDGGLFKGILARNLADLALQVGDSGLAAELARNGTAVWAASGRGGLVGGDWAASAGRSVDLSEHLSGVLLLEQCARLEAAGLLRS